MDQLSASLSETFLAPLDSSISKSIATAAMTKMAKPVYQYQVPMESIGGYAL